MLRFRTPTADGNLILGRTAVACLAIALIPTVCTLADDASQSTGRHERLLKRAPEAADLHDSPSPLPRKHQSGPDTFIVSILILAGIAMVGIFILAFIIIWGQRLRRFVRKPFPKQSLGDELWYLRPPKNSVDRFSDHADERSEASSEGESEI